MHKTVIAAALLIAGSVSAQKASYTYINQKAPYSNPGPKTFPRGPWLTAQNTPKIGKIFKVQVIKSNVPPGCNLFCSCPYLCTLIIGASNPALDIGVFSGAIKFRGFLYASIMVQQAVGQGGAGGTVPILIQIPNNKALLGSVFYLQLLRYGWSFAAPPRCPDIFELSRGLRCVAGT